MKEEKDIKGIADKKNNCVLFSKSYMIHTLLFSNHMSFFPSKR